MESSSTEVIGASVVVVVVKVVDVDVSVTLGGAVGIAGCSMLLSMFGMSFLAGTLLIPWRFAARGRAKMTVVGKLVVVSPRPDRPRSFCAMSSDVEGDGNVEVLEGVVEEGVVAVVVAIGVVVEKILSLAVLEEDGILELTVVVGANGLDVKNGSEIEIILIV